MISISDKTLCCGCGACAQVCPQHCLEMVPDPEGFLYPVTDTNSCVDCGLCNKVCPILHTNASDPPFVPRAFGGWHKDAAIRQDSSSGGAFTLLAEAILGSGGLVFGCTLDADLRAHHIAVDDPLDLTKLRGSKYVQSEVGLSYSLAKAALEKGKQVLFVGTPCQTAGLYAYLGNKRHDRLYLADFICHGVPSPAVFKAFLQEQESAQGSKMVAHRFRTKDHGWKQTGIQLGSYSLFDNGQTVRRYPAFRDPYMNAFLDDVDLRPSCYACKFKTLPKEYADFTIADFWGVDKVAPELNDKKGTSLVLVHTAHGQHLWDQVKERFHHQEVDFAAATKRNPPLLHSAAMNPNRAAFFADLQQKGFPYVEQKYMSGMTWATHKALKLLSRFEQFIKFGIVGCSNTLINLAVYYTCIHLGFHYLIAYTIGFLVSVCNAFYWNNKYIFKNKQESSLPKAFLKVVISYGLSFLLSILLMGIMVELLSISSLLAPLLKLAITIPLNFFLNKVWAFRDHKISSS